MGSGVGPDGAILGVTVGLVGVRDGTVMGVIVVGELVVNSVGITEGCSVGYSLQAGTNEGSVITYPPPLSKP